MPRRRATFGCVFDALCTCFAVHGNGTAGIAAAICACICGVDKGNHVHVWTTKIEQAKIDSDVVLRGGLCKCMHHLLLFAQLRLQCGLEHGGLSPTPHATRRLSCFCSLISCAIFVSFCALQLSLQCICEQPVAGDSCCTWCRRPITNTCRLALRVGLHWECTSLFIFVLDAFVFGNYATCRRVQTPNTNRIGCTNDS